MAKAGETTPSRPAEPGERPRLPITALLSDRELRRVTLRSLGIHLLVTVALYAALLLAWLALGRPDFFVVVWTAYCLQAWIIGPRLSRHSPVPARFYLGEPAEIALVVMLVLIALGLVLTRADGEWAAILGLTAVALVVKIAACRWEPSKDPADYR